MLRSVRRNVAEMTTIGLVSDTHLPRFGRALPHALEAGLRAANVTQILHMGDMTDPLAIDLFEALAPLDAVAGNNDPESIWKRYGRRKIVTMEGVRIGLVHGDAGRARTTHENAIAAFAGDAVDVILYGHSHQPYVDQRAGLIVANPGSPTDKRQMPLYSYGLLTIEGGNVAVALKYFGRDQARSRA
jgi:putative phosphoesterase